MKASELVDLLNKRYDPTTAEIWDRVGVVCGDLNNQVTKIYFCIDVLPATVSEAIAWNADFIIAHHPLLLHELAEVLDGEPPIVIAPWKIELKEKGISTVRPRKVWFDDTVQRLNVDGRGELLGEFRPNDRLLLINQSGKLKTIIPELTTHFDEDIVVMEKWNPNKPISAIYYDGEKERYFVKRFLVENENKEELFITEHEKSQLEIVSTDYRPMAEIIFSKRSLENLTINLEEFIAIKGIKALGNQLTSDKIKQIELLDLNIMSKKEAK